MKTSEFKLKCGLCLDLTGSTASSAVLSSNAPSSAPTASGNGTTMATAAASGRRARIVRDMMKNNF